MAAGREGMEARLDKVRGAVLDLARLVDENLRSVMLRMTTEETLAAGLELRPTQLAEQAVMARCMELLGLQAPLARDLRWSMAMIRVGKDYERVQGLVQALQHRVVVLAETLLSEILHAMTEVMRKVLKLHALLLHVWAAEATDLASLERQLAIQRDRVDAGIKAVEEAGIAAMMRGEESAESLRELVLATRHLKRIADQLAEIPNELRELGLGR